MLGVKDKTQKMQKNNNNIKFTAKLGKATINA